MLKTLEKPKKKKKNHGKHSYDRANIR
jgi:hypothetical protein